MSGNGVAGASYGDLLITSLVVLCGVCVAAFLVVRLVGRFLTTARSRGADVMTVISRLPLEPRRSLFVVEVAGKTLLVGTSEMGLSLLSELDGAEVQARAVARPSFGDMVRAAWPGRAWKQPWTAIEEATRGGAAVPTSDDGAAPSEGPVSARVGELR